MKGGKCWRPSGGLSDCGPAAARTPISPLGGTPEKTLRPCELSVAVIVIVSGLPRSGTSLMMQMLQAGGLEPLTDGVRKPDPDNPRGYFEFEKVKNLPQDASWLTQAEGRVVKIVSPLLSHLPPEYEYRIIFMRRAMAEILASQAEMLTRAGRQADPAENDRLAPVFARQIEEAENWATGQPNIKFIRVNYRDILEHPEEEARRINQFLDGRLKIAEMVKAVDPNLYRQRSGLMESRLD